MNISYFDYAATTPVDQRVIDRMLSCLGKDGDFANPSSRHVSGQKALQLIETAREQVAAYLNAEPSEIIWTSGATESDNLAIKGAAALYQRKGRHIVTAKTEHKAVLDTCQHLEKQGYQVTYLTPDHHGLISKDYLESHLQNDTILVSLMHVNNETGVVQDLQQLAEVTRSRGILLHVDAAQTVGRLPLDVTTLPVDLVSLSGHKVYGPKGIGALYLRKKPRVRVQPLIHGGGHEQGMRSGTLPTHQIVGMGQAFEIAANERSRDMQHITELRKQLMDGLSAINNMQLNIPEKYCVPHIINLRFDNMVADALLQAMPEIAASTSSACQGKGVEGSYVLKAIGLNEEQIKASIRFSMGRFTSTQTLKSLLTALGRVLRV